MSICHCVLGVAEFALKALNIGMDDASLSVSTSCKTAMISSASARYFLLVEYKPLCQTLGSVEELSFAVAKGCASFRLAGSL